MECDGCTLCCLFFPVPDLGLKAGEDCLHRKPGIGCYIYEQRPNDCVKCTCAYHQMEKASTDLRPDNCGVIFEKMTDNIFVGTKEKHTSINTVVMKQIQSFVNEGFSVLINSLGGDKEIYLAHGMTKEDVMEDMRKKRYDSSLVQISLKR